MQTYYGYKGWWLIPSLIVWFIPIIVGTYFLLRYMKDKSKNDLGLAALIALLTVFSFKLFRIFPYRTLFIPALLLLTGWMLGCVILREKRPKGISTVAILAFLGTLFCLLSPTSSARLYLFGYYPSADAIITDLRTFNQSGYTNKSRDYAIYFPEKPAIKELFVLSENSFDNKRYTNLEVKVTRYGIFYVPTENFWWKS
ncbi:hypothetical protein [Lentilactobacillus sp. Marseille-Q4993]|uniref:hypothetical protein n=1 Tax=Lentilactobacillus sp. Marseille-Q4993 TaxID=3039492 RepID=UPI0024BD3129|nr:hypothetical protein [Lentilactobacillus sp. Marseille-Q4993]